MFLIDIVGYLLTAITINQHYGPLEGITSALILFMFTPKRA